MSAGSFPQVDSFSLEVTEDLGPIKAITIGYATKATATGALGKLFGAEWYLSTVGLVDMETGKHYGFVYNGWIDSNRSRVKLSPVGMQPAAGGPKPAAPAGNAAAEPALKPVAAA